MNKKVQLKRNIKNLRTIKRLTQTELADKLRVTQTTVSKYEKGETFPTFEILTQLADFFSVSLEKLVYGDFDDSSKLSSDMTYDFDEICKSKNITVDGLKMNSNEIKLARNHIRFERFKK